MGGCLDAGNSTMAAGITTVAATAAVDADSDPGIVTAQMAGVLFTVQGSKSFADLRTGHKNFSGMESHPHCRRPGTRCRRGQTQ